MKLLLLRSGNSLCINLSVISISSSISKVPSLYNTNLGKLPDEVAKSGEELVLLCKVGDALQMRALLQACVEKLNEDDVLTYKSVIGVMEFPNRRPFENSRKK